MAQCGPLNSICYTDLAGRFLHIAAPREYGPTAQFHPEATSAFTTKQSESNSRFQLLSVSLGAASLHWRKLEGDKLVSVTIFDVVRRPRGNVSAPPIDDAIGYRRMGEDRRAESCIRPDDLARGGVPRLDSPSSIPGSPKEHAVGNGETAGGVADLGVVYDAVAVLINEHPRLIHSAFPENVARLDIQCHAIGPKRAVLQDHGGCTGSWLTIGALLIPAVLA